jgi:hypothetical protein
MTSQRLVQFQFAQFSKKTDKVIDIAEEVPKKKRGRPAKNSVEKVTSEPKIKVASKAKSPKRDSSKKTKDKVIEVFTMKFNSPVLPFTKFPLSQNKYIMDFNKHFDREKGNVKKLIGVHFEDNKNGNALGAIGIEIDLQKRNNMQFVETKGMKRFKIVEYDDLTNFAKAIEL